MGVVVVHISIRGCWSSEVRRKPTARIWIKENSSDAFTSIRAVSLADHRTCSILPAELLPQPLNTHNTQLMWCGGILGFSCHPDLILQNATRRHPVSPYTRLKRRVSVRTPDFWDLEWTFHVLLTTLTFENDCILEFFCKISSGLT